MGKYGEIYQIEYYSKYLFTDGTTSAWKETIDNDEDIVNLDTDSYNIFFNKVAEFVCGNIRSLNSDIDKFSKLYSGAVETYTADNKSQAKKKLTTYYTPFRR
jgi:hypothetical protein